MEGVTHQRGAQDRGDTNGHGRRITGAIGSPTCMGILYYISIKSTRVFCKNRATRRRTIRTGRHRCMGGIQGEEGTNGAIATGTRATRRGGWCSTDARHTPGITTAHGHGASVGNGPCAAEHADPSATRIEGRGGQSGAERECGAHPSALTVQLDTICACLFARRAYRVLLCSPPRAEPR